jgi:hypothetical protein
MILRKLTLSISLIILVVVPSACQGGTDPSAQIEEQVQAVVAATQTKQAFLESVSSARQTAEVENQPTETQTAPPTETEQPTLTLSPTPEPLHQMLPGSPSNVQFYISDFVSVDLAKDKTALGDSYIWSRMERPFTAQTMLYRDYLDIYQVNLQVSDPWVYFTIVLIGKLPLEGDIRYSVELDVDHDSRGDFLVMAALPPDTIWTTDDVWVLADDDNDIGGVFPLYEEELEEAGNGYEREIFASGEGPDRDLAWVRRDPDDRNQLQIAFKESLTGVLGFMWSVWADEGVMDPALFDYNDHISFNTAGSPSKDNHRYPLKEVALVDSTCRAWYGFIPSGTEPGLCLAGDLAPQISGYGWCEANAMISGCGSNACLTYCPRNRFCIPCKLP